MGPLQQIMNRRMTFSNRFSDSGVNINAQYYRQSIQLLCRGQKYISVEDHEQFKTLPCLLNRIEWIILLRPSWIKLNGLEEQELYKNRPKYLKVSDES